MTFCRNFQTGIISSCLIRQNHNISAISLISPTKAGHFGRIPLNLSKSPHASKGQPGSFYNPTGMSQLDRPWHIAVCHISHDIRRWRWRQKVFLLLRWQPKFVEMHWFFFGISICGMEGRKNQIGWNMKTHNYETKKHEPSWTIINPSATSPLGEDNVVKVGRSLEITGLINKHQRCTGIMCKDVRV